MPSRSDVVTFHDPPVPDGASPWLPGLGPQPHVTVVDADPAWPAAYTELADLIQAALGWRALSIEHVGSTAVGDLPAKPIIDIDLIVADPDDEAAYVSPLERQGFVLTIREPWWFGHRALRHPAPRANLHVFGLDSPEPIKHRIFRDWLRGCRSDRELYASVKREAAVLSNAAGEHVMQYNVRKEQVVREIYARAFTACGLLDD